MAADRELAAIAATQHGLVANHEARARGVSQRQLDFRVRNGRLVRVHRGVYAVAGSPRTWEQRALAAVLAGGHGAVASHTTAAAIWGLRNAEREGIEITVERQRLPRLDRVTVHRSVDLGSDRTVADGIPVTSAARTIVDLTAIRGIAWLARAMDDAMRRNIALLPHLRECTNRMRGAPGRRPTVVRMLVDERWSGGGKTESSLERIVLAVLVDAGLPEPVSQYDVIVEGHRHRLDFAWPAQLVALEVDGFGPHSSYASFHDDRHRDLRLQRAGWRVLHVTGETPAPTIVESVLAALER